MQVETAYHGLAVNVSAHPGFLATLAATLALLLISIYTFSYIRRNELDRVFLWLFVTLVVGLWWSGTQAIKLAVESESATVLMHQIQHPAIAILPLAWLCFTLVYTDHGKHVNPRSVAILGAPGAVALVLGATNFRYHDLAWSGYTFIEDGAITTINPDFGPAMVAYLAYGYVLVLAGVYYFSKMMLESDAVYRGQAAAITIGVLTPLVLNFLYLTDLVFTQDPTAIGFSVSVLCLSFAIYRYRMLDLLPVARDSVIEGMQDPYLVLDPEGRVIDANPAAREIFEQEHPVGAPLDAIAPELAAALQQDDDEIQVEHSYYTLSQDEIPTHQEGRSGTLVFLRDITEARRVEKRFQHLIENSSDLITILDGDGIVRYTSPSSSHITGYPPDEVEGLYLFEEAVHPADRDDLRDAFEDLLDRPGDRVTVEHRVASREDGWIYLESVAHNLIENPYVEGVVVNSRDVTQRRRRENELERANQRLDRFASVVTHDLRNPLTVAEGYLDLALEEDEDEHLEKVEDAHSRMNDLIDDVLSMARQSEVEPEDVDLDEAARRAWATVDTGDADLEVDGELTLRADEDSLIRALENLYRNSLEHADDGVEVTVGADGDRFYVEDDGPGFDEPEIIFDESDGYDGLGLWIVDDIARAHDWEVLAENDDGARVEFRL